MTQSVQEKIRFIGFFTTAVKAHNAKSKDESEKLEFTAHKKYAYCVQYKSSSTKIDVWSVNNGYNIVSTSSRFSDSFITAMKAVKYDSKAISVQVLTIPENRVEIRNLDSAVKCSVEAVKVFIAMRAFLDAEWTKAKAEAEAKKAEAKAKKAEAEKEST